MQAGQNRLRWIAPVIVLGVLLAQVVTHLAWLPISAHSGQVAIPWMINQGRTLFSNLLEQHAPATSLISALAMRLSNADPILVTRALNLLVVLALTALIFVLSRRLAGNTAGALAVLIWFWWEPVYGNVLFYFDSLVGLLVLLSLLLWVTLSERKASWLAPLLTGLTLGAATLAKQHAWAVIVLFALWLLVNKRSKLPLFATSALVFPVAALIVAAAQGNLQGYLYWNWGFNLSGLMDTLLPTGDLVRKLVLSNLLVPVFVLLALQRRERLWLLIVLAWLGTTTDLLPRFSDDQAMAHLPLACVMAGVALAALRPAHFNARQWWQQAKPAELVLAGLVSILALSWVWTGAVVYASAPLGRAGIPAYDEFKPLAAELRAISQPGDTLFILPETDSTPQIHPLSGMLPPGMWIKGWSWYFEAPGVLDRLLSEWAVEPPTYIVTFPALLDVGQPGIAPLLEFTDAHYELLETVPGIVFHGDALIYRYTR